MNLNTVDISVYILECAREIVKGQQTDGSLEHKDTRGYNIAAEGQHWRIDDSNRLFDFEASYYDVNVHRGDAAGRGGRHGERGHGGGHDRYRRFGVSALVSRDGVWLRGARARVTSLPAKCLLLTGSFLRISPGGFLMSLDITAR